MANDEKLRWIAKCLRLFRLGRGFGNRRAAQATVYLLQLNGMKLGYDDYEMKVIGMHSNKLSGDLSRLFPAAMKEGKGAKPALQGRPSSRSAGVAPSKSKTKRGED